MGLGDPFIYESPILLLLLLLFQTIQVCADYLYYMIDK